MKPNIWVLWTVLGLPLAAALGSRATTDDTGGLNVAVVDVGRLIKEHKRYFEDEQGIETWRAGMQSQLDEGTTELEGLRAEIETFRPGTNEFRELLDRLEMGEFRLKRQLDRLNEELTSRRAQALADAYQRVADACAALRAERGLDVVFQCNPHPVSGPSRDVVAADIVPRNVVTWSDQLDITEDVLSILNAE